MIAEQALQLCTLIDRRAVLRAHVDQLDAFQGREQKLVGLVDALQPPVEAVAALRRRGIADIRLDSRLPGVWSQLRRLEAVFREQRDDFVDGQRSGFADFERTFSALIRQIDEDAKGAWLAYTQQAAPPLEAEVLRVLASIPAYAGSGRRLRELEDTVATLRASLPSETVCTRFENASGQRRAIWEEMRGGDFGTEILQFLRAASLGGARLDAFTPAVRQWLSNHGLVDSFRITMAGRGTA